MVKDKREENGIQDCNIFNYSVETIEKLAELLTKKEKEFGHPIFIIADEPYREIAYDGVEVPFVTKYYANTLVCFLIC